MFALRNLSRKWVQRLTLVSVMVMMTGCGPLPLSMAPCTPETFFSLGKRQTDRSPYIARCPARYAQLWQAAYDEGQALAPLHRSILDASISSGNVNDRLYGRETLSADDRNRLSNEVARLDQEVSRLKAEFERQAMAVNARLTKLAAELKWMGQAQSQAMQPTGHVRAKR